MAVAERWLRHRFGTDVCNHRVFALCSDGDLSEGISHEASSLAGHQQLDRLICIYDDNRITIDGSTDLSLSDDAAQRFAAYGWHIVNLGESAEDLDALEAGLRAAMAVDDAPSLIVLRSHVAYPSPGQTDNHEAHGYSLFDDEIAATKAVMGLPADESFYVPADVADAYRASGRRSASERTAWQERVEALGPQRSEYEACLAGRGLPGWENKLPSWPAGESVATRKASSACLNAMADVVPGLVAGGADLTGNTGTNLSDTEPLSSTHPAGRQLYFGIREHAMGALLNGAALHGGLVPVGGTFLVFSDYMRPAVRLAALSGAHSIFVWSHDSVGVGEDGPTHQPIEHVMSLRAIPGLRVFRPADGNEVAQAWRLVVDNDGPSAMILTRQNVPTLEGSSAADGVARGAYTLADCSEPDVILVGTGSEVSVCVEAAIALGEQGIVARVVSMPCWELFAEQDPAYRDAVLPDQVPKLSVEAGVTLGWERWVDLPGGNRSIRGIGTRVGGIGKAGYQPGQRRRPGRISGQGQGVTKMSSLHDLYRDYGQSPWLDNLRREWILNGELSRWVERGVRGLTSNPSIFQKAMTSGDEYDEQFSRLLAEGMSVADAYWELVLTDISGALDALAPVHEESDGD